MDAFTTIFSIIATFFLVRRKLDNWMYWVMIDAVYVYLYASRGAFLFALLMGLNGLIKALKDVFQGHKGIIKGLKCLFKGLKGLF